MSVDILKLLTVAYYSSTLLSQYYNTRKQVIVWCKESSEIDDPRRAIECKHYKVKIHKQKKL